MKKYELNLIKKVARSFHNTTGYDWEELFAEAAIGYAEALQSYDSKKGSKCTTWAYTCMQNRLITFLQQERKNKFISRDESWIDFPIYQTPFFEIFDSLSPDCKIIAQMVLDDPHSYLEVPAKMARGLIVNTLIVKNKWTWRRVWDAIRNIKVELANS